MEAQTIAHPIFDRGAGPRLLKAVLQELDCDRVLLPLLSHDANGGLMHPEFAIVPARAICERPLCQGG